jgi:hypothetical protein
LVRDASKRITQIPRAVWFLSGAEENLQRDVWVIRKTLVQRKPIRRRDLGDDTDVCGVAWHRADRLYAGETASLRGYPPAVVSLADRSRVWALPGLIAFSIIVFTAGSGSVARLKHVATEGRWVVLFAELGLAAVLAWRTVRAVGVSRGLLIFGLFAGAFAALGVVSTAWSPTPRVTFERAVSVGVLFIVAACVAASVGYDPRARRRILAGIGAGAGLVAVIGFLMLALGLSGAAQEASRVTPWRFRGFGENPNTIPVLGAAVMPVVTWLWLTTTERFPRFIWALCFVALLATAVATQSRGGLVGAFVGVALVLGLLIERWPRRAMAVASLGVVVALGIVLRQATQPQPPAFYSSVRPAPPAATVVPYKPAKVRSRGGKSRAVVNKLAPPRPSASYRAAQLPPRDSEIGFPSLSRSGVSDIASGRVAAWAGALQLIKGEPLLGYGFGTESKIFVDRWYYFESDLPENSSIGILLQLGIVGFGLMVALLALLIVGSVRALRARVAETRSLAIVGLGTLAGAVTVTFIQSYIYSVGNVASQSVWIVAFLLSAAVLGPRSANARS